MHDLATKASESVTAYLTWHLSPQGATGRQLYKSVPAFSVERFWSFMF